MQLNCAGWLWKKSLFSTSISLHRMLSTLRPSGVINTCRRTVASWWRSSLLRVSGGVCWWRKMDDKVFMTRSLNVTPKTTEQHLVLRSDKSEAEVTNNRRVCSILYYWNLLVTDMKHRAASLRQLSFLSGADVSSNLATTHQRFDRELSLRVSTAMI